MFKKEDTVLLSERVNTIIGKNTAFQGTINSKDVVRIDGKTEGNITSLNDVIISESGHVSAEIKSKNITIAGHFEGTIEASGRLEIKRTGNAVGTFVANAFVVEDGATLSGNLDMKEIEKSGKPNELEQKNLDSAGSGVITTGKI